MTTYPLPLPAFTLLLALFVMGKSTTAKGQSPMTQEEVRAIAYQWYKDHPETYQIIIPEEAAAAREITAADPQGPWKEIIIEHEGMHLELVFDRDLRTLDWEPESLKEHFSHLTLRDLPLGVPVSGWTLNPMVPSSSAGKEAVTFQKTADDGITCTIQWSIFALRGYSQDSFCKDRSQWTDSPLPERCWVEVRQNLPLQLEVSLPKWVAD